MIRLRKSTVGWIAFLFTFGVLMPLSPLMKPAPRKPLEGDGTRAVETEPAQPADAGAGDDGQAPDEDRPRFALVVGVNDYERIPPLENARNDALLVREGLLSVGFRPQDIITATDPELNDLRRALNAFRGKLEGGGRSAVGFFYFAGHGIQIDGENYLIASDRAGGESKLPLSDALRIIGAAGSAVNIIALDACRNIGDKRGGLAKLSVAPGQRFLISYAAQPGTVALDEPKGPDEGKGYGPYATAFRNELVRSGDQPVEVFFKRVSESVNGYQEGNVLGEFCFAPCGGRSARPRPPSSIIVPEYPYLTIGAALRVVAEGGTVFVQPGVYNESLTLTKSVRLQGIGLPHEDRVEIVAPMHAPCLVYTPADSRSRAIVSNLHFQSKLNSQSEGCVVIGAGVFTLTDSQVLGSTVSPAVRNRGGDAVLIRNSEIGGGSEGVLVETAGRFDHIMLFKNKISANKVGLHIAHGSRAAVDASANDFLDNLDAGVAAHGYGELTLVGNSIRGSGTGILLDRYAKSVLVRGNEIAQNQGEGIAIPFGANAAIENNVISHNGGDGKAVKPAVAEEQ